MYASVSKLHRNTLHPPSLCDTSSLTTPQSRYTRHCSTVIARSAATWQSNTLCRGGAGSTEGQSSFALCHPECNEGSPTRPPFLTPPLVGFEEILHFVQNDILATIVSCLIIAVDPHVATLLGMTIIYSVIARLGTSRGNLIPSAKAEQGRPKVNLPLRSVILSVTKDLLRDTLFDSASCRLRGDSSLRSE